MFVLQQVQLIQVSPSEMVSVMSFRVPSRTAVMMLTGIAAVTFSGIIVVSPFGIASVILSGITVVMPYVTVFVKPSVILEMDFLVEGLARLVPIPIINTS